MVFAPRRGQRPAVMLGLLSLGLLVFSLCSPACSALRLGAPVNSPGAEPVTVPNQLALDRKVSTKDYELATLRQAQARVDNMDPQGAIDLIEVGVAGMTSPGNVALGYQILGDAHMGLSHARLAGAYYARALEAEPTAERLFLMANANDLGGDFETALGQYMRLAEWAGREADQYRAVARERIAGIVRIIGTPTPSP